MLGAPGQKKLIKHKAAWRSSEFQEYIESLDRKIKRRQSTRAKAIMLPVLHTMQSNHLLLLDCPDWTKKD